MADGINPVHIEHWGVFVKTPEITKSAAKVEVDTTVKNTTEQPVTPTVTEEILDGNKVVASVTTKGSHSRRRKGKVTSTLTLKNPPLWTLKAPHLYKMKTIVKVGTKSLIRNIRTSAYAPSNGEAHRILSQWRARPAQRRLPAPRPGTAGRAAHTRL